MNDHKTTQNTIVGLKNIMAYLGRSRTTIWRYVRDNPDRFEKIGKTLIFHL